MKRRSCSTADASRETRLRKLGERLQGIPDGVGWRTDAAMCSALSLGEDTVSLDEWKLLQAREILCGTGQQRWEVQEGLWWDLHSKKRMWAKSQQRPEEPHTLRGWSDMATTVANNGPDIVEAVRSLSRRRLVLTSGFDAMYICHICYVQVLR